MKTILALDLGKFETVSCLLTEDHSSIPVFKTIMTNPKTFEQFLIDVKPSLLVLEACGGSGWVVDLARKLGVEVLTTPEELPDNLNTAHEVIIVQSNVLTKQQEKFDKLHTSLQEALAEIRFLRSGRKGEKFINANQLLLEFPEDKELQASLEAARKEAEEEVERITYTRKKQAKPKVTKRDSFPDHLPREEIEVAIPGEFQQRIDSGELCSQATPIHRNTQAYPSKTRRLALQATSPCVYREP